MMSPEVAARLRHILPGETIPKNGVAGVAGVAALARYAQKPQELRQLRPLRAENTKLANDETVGVTEGVAVTCEPEIEERAALAADSVPSLYLDAWARLQGQRPAHMSEDRWQRALKDAGLFLDAWGAQAVELGWAPSELFDPPAGLVWFIEGDRVNAFGEQNVRTDGGRTFGRRAKARPRDFDR
jgi:hypothetical protein